jgi:hypothetical protein
MSSLTFGCGICNEWTTSEICARGVWWRALEGGGHWSSGQSSGMEGASGPSLGPRFASVERRDSVMASDATLRRMTSSDSIEDLLHRHSECIGSTLANISSLHKFTEIKSSPSRIFSRSPSWLLRRPTR